MAHRLPWAAEDDLDLLYHLRAIVRDASGELHPTRAGLLAFGDEFEIIGTFPYFFLDYREERSDVVRWVVRIHSDSGEWSGNTVDFYLDVVNRLDHALPSPFAVERDGWGYTTESDAKDAANEAVANALAHVYYGGSSTVRIVFKPGMLVVTNSGTLVIDGELAHAGGTSEAGNPAPMRIFSRIGKIDHAGSGLNAIGVRAVACSVGCRPSLPKVSLLGFRLGTRATSEMMHMYVQTRAIWRAISVRQAI